MIIRQIASDPNAAPWPDDCATCGQEMYTKMKADDGKTRCVRCHLKEKAT